VVHCAQTVQVENWQTQTWHGGACEFHARDLPHRRSVWLVVPDRPALVLGSSQDPGEVDSEAATAAGIDVCRRRSGGGAVWLHPEHSLWVDVTIGRGDPLWDDDVSRSGLWLGNVLAGICGGNRAEVHHGPMVTTPFSRSLCFAGLAPGEVTVDGAKLFGVSQRRGRDGARFQCVAYRSWLPELFAGVFVDAAVRDAAGSLPVHEIDLDGPALLDRLSAALAS
jgi:lipoate-protein ligase A